MATVQEVLTLIHELSDAERDELLDRLFTEDDEDDCFVPTHDPAFDAEIRRRADEVERGEAELIPWEVVRKELWARLGIQD